MKAFVNQRDYSIAFLCYPGAGPAPVYSPTDPVFEVEVAESCLDGIDEEHYFDLFYDADKNIVYRDPNLVTFKTTVGKDWLTARLQNYSLVPPEARGEDFESLRKISCQYLGDTRVDELLADGDLSDEDISAILSYINGDDDTDETP
jgi:hypothetical protein